MIIAFIVLAVLALVFLFIYNARMSKKAAKKQAQESVRNTQEAAEPARARKPQASELESDRAYREALRQFAGGTPAKDEEPPAPKPDYSTDNAYREALRSMAKNKK